MQTVAHVTVTPAPSFTWDLGNTRGTRATYIARGFCGIGLPADAETDDKPARKVRTPRAEAMQRYATVGAEPVVPAPIVAEWPEGVDYDTRQMLGEPLHGDVPEGSPTPVEPDSDPSPVDAAPYAVIILPDAHMPEGPLPTAEEIADHYKGVPTSIEIVPDPEPELSAATVEPVPVARPGGIKLGAVGKRGKRLPPPRVC